LVLEQANAAVSAQAGQLTQGAKVAEQIRLATEKLTKDASDSVGQAASTLEGVITTHRATLAQIDTDTARVSRELTAVLASVAAVTARAVRSQEFSALNLRQDLQKVREDLDKLANRASEVPNA
jgi:hypothetical protein